MNSTLKSVPGQVFKYVICKENLTFIQYIFTLFSNKKLKQLRIMNSTEQEQHEKNTWPYASLFFFGFFGKDSPGGRTLAGRTTIALLIFLAGFLLMTATWEYPVLSSFALTLIPASVLIIMWAYKEYLSGLDELSRLIQYEAFAFSYGIAMLLAVTLYAFEIRMGVSIAAIWVILAELMRGLSLVIIAKKYA